MDGFHGTSGGEDCGQARTRRRRRLKRVGIAMALGVTPVLAFAWAGCSDDPKSTGAVYVDPGGTFGAEFSISVIGRGRVTADVPGVDCPSDCFSKYIFASATADGAAGGVTLKAIPTPGSNFKGWSFDTEPIGSKGRGPEACNPIKRPGAAPPVSATDMTVLLRFGEVVGVPPTGQEGACGSYTKVPVVYKVTATFDGAEPIDDGGTKLDGGDGGAPEIIYEPPVGGVSASSIGSTFSGLYWLYSGTNGYSGIAYGGNPSSSIIPQTAQIVLNPTQFATVSQFEVDQQGVVYQTSSGVFFVQAGSVLPQAMTSAGATCSALATDVSDNVYCRTSSTIVMWAPPYLAAPKTLFVGLLSGSDLAIDGTTAYFSTSSAVNSISILGADGGVATATPIVSSRFSPTGVEVNSSNLWWAEGSALYTTSKLGGGIATSTGASATAIRMAADTTSSSFFWSASTTTIYRAYYSGGVSTQVFRSGLTSIAGVAGDSQFVYWTQSDGRIRRVAF